MKKLSTNEINELKSYKGLRGGKEIFLEKLESLYTDSKDIEDKEILKEIKQCRSIFDSLYFIESYPAYMKSQEMYYTYMDKLLKKIGYKK